MNKVKHCTKRSIPAVVFITILTVVNLQGCSNDENGPKKVRLKERLLSNESVNETADTPSINFAIGAMITPDETLVSYKKILDFISEETGKRYKLVMRDSYTQINELIRDGAVDLAFICSGAYVDLSEKTNIELLAAPVVKGKAYYHAPIIVPSKSNSNSFDDLKGKSFAFVDPLSNTGRFYPLSLLIRKGTGPSKYFSNHTYTYSHTASIEMVASGDVDGAAVDSLVFSYMLKKNSGLSKQVKIIEESPPYATPPIVASDTLDKSIKQKIKHILITMHKTVRGKEILDELGIERFESIEDERYSSIRALQKMVSENGF